MGLNPAAAFWFAYIVTRPLGASFADYLSKPHSLSGLAFGDLPTTAVFVAALVLLVGYLQVTRHDSQPAPRRNRESLAPGPLPRGLTAPALAHSARASVGRLPGRRSLSSDRGSRRPVRGTGPASAGSQMTERLTAEVQLI